jgi:nitroreductase
MGDNLRLGFGQNKVEWLCDLLIKLDEIVRVNENYINNAVIHSAISTIQNYVSLHGSQGFKLQSKVEEKVNVVLDIYKDFGFQKSIKSYPENKYDKSLIRSLILERRSVRHFQTDKVISNDLIEKAVKLAVNCPSACNRQPYKVRVIKEPSKIKALCEIQGGTAGFSEIPLLLLITYSRTFYHNSIERNSGFIDSGIFLMNLVYSLSIYELDCCILNNAFSTKKDQKMRTEIKTIGGDEEFVVFIAVGYGKVDSFVPASIKNEIPLIFM